MCTMIVETATIAGSGKGARGWFSLTRANVSYDHPFHTPLDNALNIDFVDESEGVASRVAVELTRESALELIKAITAALDRGEAYD